MRVVLLLFIMEWNKIQNGEGGSLVRAKINNAIQGLINGDKGLLRVWENLRDLFEMVESNKSDSNSKYNDLKKGVQRSYAHTDKEVSQIAQAFTEELTAIRNAKLRNKGFYSTLDVLIQNWPTSEAGTIAYVGTSIPYKIYKWSENGGWYDTGEVYSGEEVNVDLYLKKGLTIGGTTQLVDIDGKEIHPITSAEAVMTADGRNLESVLEQLKDVCTLDEFREMLTAFSNEVLLLINANEQRIASLERTVAALLNQENRLGYAQVGQLVLS